VPRINASFKAVILYSRIWHGRMERCYSGSYHLCGDEPASTLHFTRDTAGASLPPRETQPSRLAAERGNGFFGRLWSEG